MTDATTHRKHRRTGYTMYLMQETASGKPYRVILYDDDDKQRRNTMDMIVLAVQSGLWRILEMRRVD